MGLVSSGLESCTIQVLHLENLRIRSGFAVLMKKQTEKNLYILLDTKHVTGP